MQIPNILINAAETIRNIVLTFGISVNECTLCNVCSRECLSRSNESRTKLETIFDENGEKFNLIRFRFRTHSGLFEIIFSALRQKLDDLHTIYMKRKHQQIIIQNAIKIVAQSERCL